MTREEGLAQLAGYRNRIDEIDIAILKLINQRTQVVEQIGRVKRELNLPIYEPKREDDVFRNVTQNNPGPLSQDAVKRVFERIIDEMRTVQRERMLREQQPDGHGGNSHA
jgi:chorismate mutase-like protein